MSNIKILVVNYHAIFRDGIRTLLKSHGDIEVIGEACEGRESVDKVRELSPDVVLMDTNLPGMGGLEAIRRIIKQGKDVKILALMQYEDKEYVSSVIRAGVAGCISMKASGAELVAAIKTVHNGNIFLCPCAARMLVENYVRSVKTDTYDLLTPREKETLKLIAEGYRSRNIAVTLGIDLKTVYGHRSRMLKKLDLHNTTDLIKFAVKNRLVTTEGIVRNAAVRD